MKKFLASGSLWLMAGGTAMAVLMVSAGYVVQRAWVGGGGSRATSASFDNLASLGQPAAGSIVSSGSYRLRAGFIQAFTVNASTNTNCYIANPALDTVCSIVGPSGLITVTVPGGALVQVATITLSLPLTYPAGSSPMGDFAATGRGVQVDLGPPAMPSKPIRIDFTYQDTDAPSGVEERLRLGAYDAGRTQWNPLPGRQNTTTNVLTVFPRDFGTFQLLELQPAPDIENPIIAPNPFRPSQGHTRMIFGRLPEDASVEIFTLSGERVRRLEVGGGGQASWDVTNDSGEKVVSGSYLVVIRRESSNVVRTIAVER